jgi:hypothetical protein
MAAKLIFSLFFFFVFVVWGIIGIIFPEFTYRTTATNTLKKKPTKSAIKRYKFSSYMMVIVGIVLIIVTLLGGFKGV